jgi:hypothetical protein
MDILTLMIMGFGTYIGYKRGLMLELTDWCIMIFAGLVAFRGFRPFGSFMKRVLFKEWSQSSVENIAFWMLLMIFGIAILTAGLHIDRATREFDRIPPEVRNYGGMVTAFFKCLVICCLLAAYLPHNKGLAEAEKIALRGAASTRALHAMSGPVTVLVAIVTPEDIAAKFRKAIR